jgi:hypothetical protein
MPGPSVQLRSRLVRERLPPSRPPLPARTSRHPTPMNTLATAILVDCDHAPSLPTKAAEDVQLHQPKTLDSHCSVGCGIRRAHAG